MSESSDASSKKEELRAFLLITVILAPVVTVSLIGSYGFLIWISQILTGPPGS